MEINPTQTLNNPTTEQLIFALTGVFETHIKQLVDARVNQIFEAHATVKQLDEQWEERVRGYVQEAMDEHEAQNEHIDKETIEVIASDEVHAQIDGYDFDPQIKQTVWEIINDADYVTEERVVEMIDNADIEDQVKEALRGLL